MRDNAVAMPRTPTLQLPQQEVCNRIVMMQGQAMIACRMIVVRIGTMLVVMTMLIVMNVSMNVY